MSAETADPSFALVLQAGELRGRDEFLFHIVNRSVARVPYDRASVWETRGRFSPLAVSGIAAPDGRGAFSASWSSLLRGLKGRDESGALGPDRFRDASAFTALAAKTGGLSAVWVPIPGRRMAALFERWGENGFTGDEAGALRDLIRGYSLVWRPRRREGTRLLRPLAWMLVMAAIAAAFLFVRLPLRVVAVCEVAARNPRLVSAPMDGVVDAVLVAPGQRVEIGDEIAVYDSRLMEEELKISRRQVEVVEAELASARARGFSESRYRGEVALLEARLEQELARLEALEVRFSRRLVTAPVAGMVQLDDARAWRGRPVSTGQAILWLVDPADSRVRLWLPQDDRIDFDFSRPIHVYLYAVGGDARPARLTYVSSLAQPTPDGGYAFPAEAEWEGAGEAPPLGLRGTASIYGQETTLGYWLFRRPMGWVRRWLGV